MRLRGVYICGFDTETDWNADRTRAWIAQWSISTPDGTIHGRSSERLRRSVQLKILRRFNEISEAHGETLVAVHNLNFDARFLLQGVAAMYSKADCRDGRADGNDAYQISYRNSRVIALTLWHRNMPIRFQDTALLHPGTTVADLGMLLGREKLLGEQPAFRSGWSRGKGRRSFRYVDRDAEIAREIRRLDWELGIREATISAHAWKALKRGVCKGHPVRWEHYFPKLTKEEDELSRACYVGGLNWSEHPGAHSPVYHADINSSYPHKLAAMPLPYGHPSFSDRMPECGYWETLFWARLRVRPGCVAWYSPKRITDLAEENEAREQAGMKPIEAGDHVYETLTAIPLAMNSIDWETLNEDYEISELQWSGTWACYMTRSGICKPYIDELMEKKKELKKRIRNGDRSPVMQLRYEQVKRQLNAPSGRFGLRRETCDITLDADGVMHEAPGEDATDSYVPVICAVCAYGRQQVIRALRSVRPELRYHVDTDSVIAGEMPDVVIGDELGQWTLDRPAEIIEGGPKKYIEFMDRSPESMELTCAGVPQRMRGGAPVGMQLEIMDRPELISQPCELGHEHYRVQSEWLRGRLRQAGLDPDDQDTRKLLPRHVEGGVILEPTTYKLHDGNGWQIRIGRRGRY